MTVAGGEFYPALPADSDAGVRATVIQKINTINVSYLTLCTYLWASLSLHLLISSLLFLKRKKFLSETVKQAVLHP